MSLVFKKLKKKGIIIDKDGDLFMNSNIFLRDKHILLMSSNVIMSKRRKDLLSVKKKNLRMFILFDQILMKEIIWITIVNHLLTRGI